MQLINISKKKLCIIKYFILPKDMNSACYTFCLIRQIVASRYVGAHFSEVMIKAVTVPTK